MSISGLDDRATQPSEEDRAYLVALERWPSYEFPRLTDEQGEWVCNRIDELQQERLARADAHRERLAKTAGFLGREVADHQITLPDAQRRLEAMAMAMDAETDTPQLLVPYVRAVAIIEDAFARGYRSVSGAVRAVAP